MREFHIAIHYVLYFIQLIVIVSMKYSSHLSNIHNMTLFN